MDYALRRASWAATFGGDIGRLREQGFAQIRGEGILALGKEFLQEGCRCGEVRVGKELGRCREQRDWGSRWSRRGAGGVGGGEYFRDRAGEEGDGGGRRRSRTGVMHRVGWGRWLLGSF